MSADLLERPIRKGRSKRVTMATRRRLLSRTPRAAAILVDELDAGSFKCAPNYIERRMARLTCARFKLMDSHDPNLRLTRKLLLAPTNN